MQHILQLRPDIIKLDMGLVRDVDTDPAKRALGACKGQGYLLGKPMELTQAVAPVG